MEDSTFLKLAGGITMLAAAVSIGMGLYATYKSLETYNAYVAHRQKLEQPKYDNFSNGGIEDKINE